MDDTEAVAETREDVQPVVASDRTATKIIHELTEPSKQDIDKAAVHRASAPSRLEQAKEKLHGAPKRPRRREKRPLSMNILPPTLLTLSKRAFAKQQRYIKSVIISMHNLSYMCFKLIFEQQQALF